MKKIIVMMAAIVAMTLVAFTPNSTTWKTHTTETLYNSEYDAMLTLYSRGSVTLKSPNVVCQGTYDIAPNKDITFRWEDEPRPESGFVTTVSTTSGLRIRSVVAKGITFTNTERFVVNRR